MGSAEYSFREVGDVPDAGTLWQKICDLSGDAWLWQTWVSHEYHICAARQYDVVDRSFFVYKGDRAIGVVPLTFQKSDQGIDAIYYSGFLPWPFFVQEEKEHIQSLEEAVFKEIDHRANDIGATYIRLWFAPPIPGAEDDDRTARVAHLFGYDRVALPFHEVAINSETLVKVRDRYRRYYKKYFSDFSLRIVADKEVTPELIKNYAELHCKDAGRVTRSFESFERHADFVRLGEGFFVVAETPEKMIVGMLVILSDKKIAYDGSVAVDPEFADRYVGHLLKWKAIEELQKRHASSYILGPVAGTGASPKELGISHFKEGWSRGNTRIVWQLEKNLR